MTYKQLMGEVAALGFEEGVEDESSFRYAANRALLQLANEYRTYRTAVFCLPAPRRHRLAAARTLCPGEYISLFCPAGGVSLRVGGRGILTADTGGKIARRIFERDDALFRLCLPEGGTLTVRADGYVMCGETAHYEGIFTREEDIPLPEGGRDILLSDIPDFLSAGELPADRRGTPVRGAEIIGNRLTLPAGCPGTVRLTYAHLPEKNHGRQQGGSHRRTAGGGTSAPTAHRCLSLAGCRCLQGGLLYEPVPGRRQSSDGKCAREYKYLLREYQRVGISSVFCISIQEKGGI